MALLAGAALGLAAFALYLATLAPTILYHTDQMKDSAVLPAVAHTLGISHPTGHPTYTILTHLFTYLPVGDVAYRVNLASAVFGALTVALHFGVGYRLSRSIAASVLGAVAFGVSGLFWSQAIIAEVYALHVLLLALVLAAIVGLVYPLFRDRAAFALLGFLFAGFLFYALEYDISAVYHYFIPTHALLALCTSVGLGALLGEAEIPLPGGSASGRV